MRRPLDWMYPEGIFAPDELLPALYFSRTGFLTALRFGAWTAFQTFKLVTAQKERGCQESLRLLQLRDFVYVSLRPTTVWRAREPRKPADRRPTVNSFWRYASNKIDRVLEHKERIDCRCAALNRLGVNQILNFIARNTIPNFAALRDHRVAAIERTMLLCGYDTKLTNLGRADRIGWLLLGAMARHLIRTRLRL